ncbi:hypothetical protein TWF694_001893 [Orbilia ellipsospora]|uniref:Uncharacterized protein n=1 Tax=Orbilia ellipsospora TaxID=2528407 RepID=A0AAV9X453_9PEZI
MAESTKIFREVFLYGPESNTTWILDYLELEELKLNHIISLERSFRRAKFRALFQDVDGPSSAASEIEGVSKSLWKAINELIKRNQIKPLLEKEWEISFFNWCKDLLKNVEELNGVKPLFTYTGNSSWGVYREAENSYDLAKSVTMTQVHLRQDRLNPYIPQSLHRVKGLIPDICYGLQLDTDATWGLDKMFWMKKLPAANCYSALKNGVRETILFPYLLHELKVPKGSMNEATDQLLRGMTQCLHGIVDAINPDLDDKNNGPLRTVFGLATVGTKWELYVLYLVARQPKKAKQCNESKGSGQSDSSKVGDDKIHKFFRRIASGNLLLDYDTEIRYFVWVMHELLKHIETELFPSVIKALKEAAGEKWSKVFKTYKPPNFRRPSVLNRPPKTPSKQPEESREGRPNFKFSDTPECAKGRDTKSEVANATNKSKSRQPKLFSCPLRETEDSSEDKEGSEAYKTDWDDSGYFSCDNDDLESPFPSLKDMTIKDDIASNRVCRESMDKPESLEDNQTTEFPYDEDLQLLYKNFSEELWKELFALQI